MTRDGAVNGWAIGAIIAVLAAVIVSLGVAQVWFSGEEEATESVTTETNDGSEETTQPSVASTSTTHAEAATTTPPSAAVGDHPLCDLHDTLLSATEDHLPVENSDDLETHVTSQIEFNRSAIEVVDQVEGEGFSGMLGWYEALASYYEPLEWNPAPGIEVLAENPPPQPSADAVSAVSATLQDLCGIVAEQDQPAP